MTTTLAPVRETESFPRFTRSGPTRHRECWAAESPDGVWSYRRLELPGTPWELTHNPSGGSVWYGSLRAARAAVADGSALEVIEANRQADARVAAAKEAGR